MVNSTDKFVGSPGVDSFSKAIVETVSESILILDANLKVKSANKSFYDTFKVSPEATEGKLIYELGNRQWDIPELKKLLEEILPQKNVFNNFEVNHNFSDIGQKVMLLNARKLDQEVGQEPAILLAIDDITLRKNLENKLATYTSTIAFEKAQDEAVLTGIGDGVFTLDTAGKITLFNPAATKITGFMPQEVIGQPFEQILKFERAQDNTPENNFIKEALKGKKNQMLENTFVINKAGVKVAVADSAAPILDSLGKVIGAVVVFRDVTQQRELERIKSEVVASASHELRTPMTAIQGFVAMMLEGNYGPISKEIKEPLDLIAESTKRLLDLVSDMLDVSRVEDGKLQFKTVDIDINHLLQEVVLSLQPVAAKKGIALTFASQTLLKVKADPDKTKQIVINLIGNSIKFTDKGAVSVSIESQGSLVQILVKDTGVGISKENQSKLFGKFVQVNSEQTGKLVGTGLGLYLSRELAKKMGGDVWLAASEKDKGSLFIFSLPKAA